MVFDIIKSSTESSKTAEHFKEDFLLLVINRIVVSVQRNCANNSAIPSGSYQVQQTSKLDLVVTGCKLVPISPFSREDVNA